MAGDVIVKTQNLTKVYRDFWGRRKKTALNALNLEIRRGDVHGSIACHAIVAIDNLWPSVTATR